MSLPSYNTSIITAVAKTQQGLAVPKFIMGGKGGSGGNTYQLFKKDTSYVFSVWRSQKYRIGKPFKIVNIKIPLGAAVAANMSIIPVLRFDDEASSSIGNTINTTNYPNSEKYVELGAGNFNQAMSGKKNFYLELQHTGSALLPVVFPIEFLVETLEKNP